MNTALSRILGALTISVALSVYAAAPRQAWNSPLASVNGDQLLQRKIHHYLGQGYELVNVEETAYTYPIAPDGDYPWGEIKLTLRTHPEDASSTISRIRLTCYIDYRFTEDGFSISGFDLFEETVY